LFFSIEIGTMINETKFRCEDKIKVMLVIPDGTMFYTWQKKNEFTEITIISFDLCNFEGTNPQMDDSCMFKCIL